MIPATPNIDPILEDLKSLISDGIDLLSSPTPSLVRAYLIARINEIDRYLGRMANKIDFVNSALAIFNSNRSVIAYKLLTVTIFETKSWAERELSIQADPVVCDMDYSIRLLESKLEVSREIQRRLRSMVNSLEGLLKENL